jgi:hypothetical protein
MKISQALLQLIILTHTLTTTTTLATPADASGPPVFDGHVDTHLIKNREPDFLQMNDTDLALEECGVDVASRQLEEFVVLTIVVSLLIVAIVVGLITDADDNPVSTSNLNVSCIVSHGVDS